MPIANLELPSDWNIEETVKLAVQILPLGDSYSQSVGSDLVDRRFQLRSHFISESKLKEALSALKNFQGDASFNWSPDGVVPLQPFFCQEWSVTHYPTHWTIEGELESDPNGECEIFRAELNEEEILRQLSGSIAWLSTYTRDTKPFVVNSTGISCNSFHDVLGRGGYLPPSTGTTEGQASLIRALLFARKTVPLVATAKTQALNLANLLASALEPYFYGSSIPANPTAQVWLPHWVINAREAFVSKGSQAPPDFLNYGYFDVPIEFTAGVGNAGTLLADLAKVYSVGGKLLWRNVAAPLVGGTESGVSYWVSNLQLKGQNYRFSPNYQNPGANAPMPTAEPAGKIVLTMPFTGTLWISYSAYDGASIAVNQKFDAFPMWRPLQAGEINHAFDVSWWIDEAYELLHEATGLAKWQRARDANKYSTIQTSAILNESFLFKREIGADPFAYPGTGYVIVNNTAGGTAVRVADGGVQVSVADGAEPFPSAELQNFAIAVAIVTDTYYRVELACSVSTLAEVVVSLNKNPANFDQEYTAWLPLPAGLTTYTTTDLNPSWFVRWTTETWWHSTNSDNPVYTYQGGGGSAAVVRELQSIGMAQRLVTRLVLNRGAGFVGAGFVLFGATNQPPAINYKSSEIVTLRVQDSLGAWFTWDLPVSPTFTTFAPEWPSEAGDGPIQAIDLQPTTGNAEISVYWIGVAPEALLSAATAYKHIIRTRVDGAYQFKVGEFRAYNSPLNYLKYNPGAVPFTVNQIGSQIDAWRGSLYVGYQSPSTWIKWGESDRALQVLNCFSDAQSDYGRRGLGASGPMSPVYYWPIWSEGVFGDYNTWGWQGADPNTEWAQYNYRALESAAKAWSFGTTPEIKRLAQRVVMNFLRYLDKKLRTTNGQPPTNIPSNLPPQTLYHDPAAAALIMRAAIYANLAGGDPAVTYRLIRRTLTYLTTQYVDTGTMAGSHTAGQPTFAEGGQTYREYFGFWAAEIVEALALLTQKRQLLRMPPCAISV